MFDSRTREEIDFFNSSAKIGSLSLFIQFYVVWKRNSIETEEDKKYM